MILTIQTRNSIIAKLFKIMRMTTKYDYIPDDRLKKQLLLKEQTSLEKSRTVNEYIDKINYIIHSINNDTGIISQPIKYEDLSPRNMFDKDNIYGKHPDFHLNNYDMDHTNPTNQNNVGVSSSFHRIYDIYTMTNSNHQKPNQNYQNHQKVDNKSIYNKQIKNNLNNKTPSIQYFHQGYPDPINQSYMFKGIINEEEFNRDIQSKKKIGLQEAKDSVVDLLRGSIETRNFDGYGSLVVNKKPVDNGIFSKYLDYNSLDEFIDYIKKEEKFTTKEYKWDDIENLFSKLLDISYKIRLLLIEVGNQRDFVDYKKIRDILEYQIKHKEIPFIDSFFLKNAEELINKIANKSRKSWFIDNPKGGSIDETYDLLISNILTK